MEQPPKTRDDELATILAALDERIRRDAGWDSGSGELTASVAELRGCLARLERLWPRGGGAAGDDGPAAARAVEMGGPLRAIGRFRIERELGRGGFGIVFLAHDPVLSREVALKVPRPEVLADHGLRERFLREARAAASLDHPNIVPVFEAGEADGICYVTSAYCPGGSLAEWVGGQREPVGATYAAQIVRQLAAGIHYTHTHGILHRDLKPANVLLFPASDGENGDVGSLGFVPKIGDFGLAKIVEESLHETRTSVLLGTPLYMAPEQAEGRLDEVGPWSDVFALGVILYELLAGRGPYDATTLVGVLDQVRSDATPMLRSARRDTPRDLDAICCKCLRKRPEDRYRSADEVAAELGRHLRGEPIQTRPPRWLDKVCAFLRREQRIRDAGVFCVVFYAASAVWMVAVGWRLLLADWLDTDDARDNAARDAWLVAAVCVPQIWLGLKVLSRRGWAIYSQAILSVAWTTFGMLQLLEIDTTIGDSLGYGPERFTINLMMTSANAIEVFLFAAAVYAYRANRPNRTRLIWQPPDSKGFVDTTGARETLPTS